MLAEVVNQDASARSLKSHTLVKVRQCPGEHAGTAARRYARTRYGLADCAARRAAISSRRSAMSSFGCRAMQTSKCRILASSMCLRRQIDEITARCGIHTLDLQAACYRTCATQAGVFLARFLIGRSYAPTFDRLGSLVRAGTQSSTAPEASGFRPDFDAAILRRRETRLRFYCSASAAQG
jgi:hypothetical protein